MARKRVKASPPKIGTLNEKPLHAALRGWYARKGDRFEVAVDGSLIDIVRGKLLIEIQTGTFSALRRKLGKLVASHRVRLVYPIAQDKWIIRIGDDGRQISSRRSPKHGRVENVFEQLVSIPTLLNHPNFSLEVLITREEEVRRQGLSRSWRRKGWGVQERRLLDVVDRWVFETPEDVLDMLPQGLPEPFDTEQLAAALSTPRAVAQQMAYCLREMDAVAIAGKRGNAILYRRSEGA